MLKNQNNFSNVLIISGPTASGKTNLSEKIAQEFDGEIINADVGQFYVPLSIGTAKPDWKNSPLKQHLFDIIDEPVNFNVSRYRELVFDKVNEIWAQNAIPILVGGSGFYLKSLFQAPCFFQALASKQLKAL